MLPDFVEDGGVPLVDGLHQLGHEVPLVVLLVLLQFFEPFLDFCLEFVADAFDIPAEKVVKVGSLDRYFVNNLPIFLE